MSHALMGASARFFKLPHWAVAGFMALGCHMAHAQIAVDETFRNATAPGWNLSGTAVLTAPAVDAAGDGWLRLTTPQQNQAGSAIYNTAFSSTAGVDASFQYATYGGNGADGFTFYLIDGSTVTPTIGARGGSLGYSWGHVHGPGVTNGYVGIGFDEYGNFATSNFGGCNAGVGCGSYARNRITVRGSGSLYGTNAAGDPQNRTTGFDMLHRAVPPGSAIETTDRAGAKTVRIVITPAPDVTMTVQVDGVTVIDHLPLVTAGTPVAGMAALPATFKMGFSASTGGSTNYHEIRNLQVQALTEATDDKERTGMGVPVSGNVSGNDRAPAGSTFSITAPPPAAEGTVTLDPATGAYTFTPAPGFAGDAHFTYQLCSGPNHTRPCVTANVTVAVNPVAVNDDYRTTQGVPVNDTVAGNDTAPTNAVFSLTTPPAAAEGSVTMNADGSFIFTPATGFTGTANFGYRVCNAAGTHCATTVVAVAVGTATPPVVLPDSFNGQPGQRITGHVGTNDPTVPLGAVFSLVPGTAPDPATQGVLQFNPDGRFTFTPVAGFTGTISFSYQLCSGAGGTAPCVTTTVTLNIRPAAAGVQAVPTLHTWALMGLAALLGGLGARRQRKA